MAITPTDITSLDPLIHQPTRLLILTTLYPVESADFLYLLQETGLTKGNLSAHTSKLEEAGYVAVEKTYRGKTPLTIYQMTENGRNAFNTYREQLKLLAAALPD
jgi:DNA-binding MarR family transcriptional regulator